MDLMSFLLRARVVNALAFLATVVAMLFALYLQHYQHLEPCPLCVFQRVAVMTAGLFFLLAALHNPAATGQRVYAALSCLGSIGGALIAGRHVWLQHLPADEVPACGPDLDYMLDVFPFQEVIATVLRGSGECAVVDWHWLGLSLPGWTLVMFIGLAGVSLFQLLRPYRPVPANGAAADA